MIFDELEKRNHATEQVSGAVEVQSSNLFSEMIVG